MPETPDDLHSSVNIDADSLRAELQGQADAQSSADAGDLMSGQAVDVGSPRRRSPDVQYRETLRNQRQEAFLASAQQQAERQRLMTEATRQRLDAAQGVSAWDAEAANARSSARAFIDNSDSIPGVISAPADAGASFVDPRFQSTPQEDLGPQWNTWDPNDAAWKARGMGLNYAPPDAAFVRGATFEDTSSPWYGTDEEAAAPGLSDRVRGFLRDRYAGPSASASPGPTPYADYDSAREAEKDLLESARNKYTAEGRYGEIGGEGFNAEINEAKVSMGLATAEETPGFLSRYGQSLGGGGAFGIGYGLMQGGEAIARSQELSQSGQYVTPEEQDKAAAGILPAAGLIGGSLIGAAIPGIGPILGGFGGQAIMSGVAGSIGAGDDRAQASREAADRLAESLGSASQSIDTFRGQIEATGAPVQQLGQGLLSLQGFGAGVGSAAIAGAGRMALAEGTDYLKDTQAVGSFLAASPGRYQMLDQFATSGGELSGADFRGIARDALFEGNFGAYNAAQQGAAAVRVRGDDAAQAAEREISKDSTGAMSLAYDAEDWLGISNNRSRARITLNNRQAELTTDDGSAGDRQYSLDVGAARLALTRSEADQSGQQAGYGLASVNGASAADLARLLPGIGASVGRAVSADQSLIGLLDPNNPDDALKIAKLQADQGQRELGFAQAERQNTLQGIGEADASYRLGNLTDTLSGVSNARQAPGDIAHDDDMIRRARTAPFLSPTERAQIEGSALQDRHAVQMGVFSEALDRIGADTAAAGVGVTRAQSFGGPSDVAAAQTQVLQEFQARIRELTAEIGSGTLTVAERTNAERQLSEARGGAISLQAAIGRDESLGFAGIADTNRETAGTGLSRLFSLGTVPGATLLGADQAALSAAQGIVANTPQQAADKALAIRQAQLGLAQDTTRSQTYATTPDERMRLGRDQTDFEIARIAPYTGGPDSNPLTMGNALLGDLQGQLSRRVAADRSVTDPLAREANQDAENAIRLQIAELREQQQQAQFGALPEMIAGSPGRGVGAALIAPAALSARFSPNANVGSWGSGHPGEAISAGAGNSEESRYLSAIATGIDKLVQHVSGGSRAFQPSVPQHNVNAVAGALDYAYNPHTGR